jgi:hypothetical protein
VDVGARLGQEALALRQAGAASLLKSRDNPPPCLAQCPLIGPLPPLLLFPLVEPAEAVSWIVARDATGTPTTFDLDLARHDVAAGANRFAVVGALHGLPLALARFSAFITAPAQGIIAMQEDHKHHDLVQQRHQ